MELFIEAVVYYCGLMVPVLALWAIAALYLQQADEPCGTTQFLYFGALLLISFVTLRTVASNDGCWLVHTSSLGVMIVAGVMRRPAESPAMAAGSLFG